MTEQFQAPPPDAMMIGNELEQFLKSVIDHGTGIDTGGGFGQRDLWITVQGNEYMITIKATGNVRRVSLKDGV